MPVPVPTAFHFPACLPFTMSPPGRCRCYPTSEDEVEATAHTELLV